MEDNQLQPEPKKERKSKKKKDSPYESYTREYKTEETVAHSVIVTDDSELNDFKIAWNHFGCRPSKLNYYALFSNSGMWSILDNYFKCEDGDYNRVTEIIRQDDGYSSNNRYFIKITNDVFIGFYEHHREVDGEMYHDDIRNIVLYYNTKKLSLDKSRDIIAVFSSILVEEPEYDLSKVNLLNLNGDGQFDMEDYDLRLKIDNKNFNLYYNDSVLEKRQSLIKKINKSSKGLTILYGQRGTGKTTFLTSIIKKINRTIIYVPFSLLESVVNNYDFGRLVTSIYNPTLIIESDYLFKNNNNLNVYSIIDMVDGIMSNNWGLQIILNLNQEDISQDLLSCNNLMDVLHFEKLSIEKSNKLSSILKKNITYENPQTVNSVVRGLVNDRKRLGF